MYQGFVEVEKEGVTVCWISRKRGQELCRFGSARGLLDAFDEN